MMDTTVSIDLGQIASDLRLNLDKVERTIELLDEGNTIHFITRYRRDQTGGLDEEQIRQIQDSVSKARLLADRKSTILKSIESQGKLTPQLERKIRTATSTKRLEDLYLPFKPKKQTLATLARQRGLEPLANEIFEGSISTEELAQRAPDYVRVDKDLNNLDDVMQGVGYLLAERFGERADLRGRLRKVLWQTGKLTCNAAAGVEKKEAVTEQPAAVATTDGVGTTSPDTIPTEVENTAPNTAEPAPAPPKTAKKDKKKQKSDSAFKDYYDYSEPLTKIPPHRVLAINRGERGKVLRIKVEAASDEINQVAEKLLIDECHPHREFLQSCLKDTLSRLALPSLEREIRRELTEKAESHAVHVFARNLRNLLLQPPVHGRRVLAVDPGFRNGCKIAAVDQFGSVLAHDVVHIVGNEERRAAGRARIVELIKENNLSIVAVGNGTACRETEELISDAIANELKDVGVEYVVVNEAGASVYSTSSLGREELPDHDATIRGAISIGRRLLDPLSELVKINAANIGVGLYQHDVKANHLRDSLDDVVASCVNYVGVDVNTASPALLRYVSGLNQLTARRLYEHRQENGPFKSREQLKEVPGFGDATFVQSAGFLKISGSDNPLDATWIHPESYEVATQVLEKLDSSVAELAVVSTETQTANASEETTVRKTPPIVEKVKNADQKTLMAELGVGELLLKDILDAITRPGRDPREDLPAPIFRRGIIKLEDLKPGMALTGTVLNVVDFGAFVDIGLKESGLVHISRLADRFVGDPHTVVSVGDVMQVWVLEIDKERRRVSLTAIEPGTEKPTKQRREKFAKQGGGRRPRSGQSNGQGGKSKQAKPPKYKTAKRPKPKPVKPITKAMSEGKEAMRSFSDLKQFFEQKPEDEGDAKEGEK